MSEPVRYGKVAVVLHWTTAALIVIAFVLGLTVDSFPKPAVGAVINLHSLLGLAVIALAFARLAWRLIHPAPELPASFSPLLRKATAAGHAALYLLMIVVPIIGVPTLLYRGRGLDFGFAQIASPFPRTPEIFRPLTEVHEIAAYALIALAAAHMVAAIYHHVALRDDTMRRMSPWIP